jgi:hypothetical protein
MYEKTIVEASRPNAGRIYDYLLGGHHNFEIDRRAGDQIKLTMPFLPKLMRLMRWCLQDVGVELGIRRGYDTIIDFASGLPTLDHLHSAVAPGTTVIYSDRDPICVEYGREILGDTPNIHYFQADCRWPDELLNRPEVQEILGGKRRVGMVYWGISMYLQDDEIAHIARTLYDWADKGSTLAFYVQNGSMDDPIIAKTVNYYNRMGEPIYLHTIDVFEELVKPWKPDELGFRTMQAWHDMEVEMTVQDQAGFPEGTSGYGVFLVK